MESSNAAKKKNPLNYFSTYRNSFSDSCRGLREESQGDSRKAVGRRAGGENREAAANPADELQPSEPAKPMKRYMKVIWELLPRHHSN